MLCICAGSRHGDEEDAKPVHGYLQSRYVYACSAHAIMPLLWLLLSQPLFFYERKDRWTDNWRLMGCNMYQREASCILRISISSCLFTLGYLCNPLASVYFQGEKDFDVIFTKRGLSFLFGRKQYEVFILVLVYALSEGLQKHLKYCSWYCMKGDALDVRD